MELGRFSFDAMGQLEAQELPEQRVIPEPEPVVVERADQGAALHQPFKPLLPVARSGEGVGERPAHLLDDRRAQQEVEHGGRLSGHDLGHQVVAHGSVVAGEALNEGARVRVASQRQRGQPEAGDPALGPLPQQPQIVLADPELESFQQLLRLGDRERQICAPDLLQTAGDAQPLQAEGRVGTGGQHEAHAVGGVLEQRVEIAQHLRVVHLVEVVEDQHDRPGQGFQLRHQGGQEGVEVAAPRWGERRKRVVRSAECGHDRAPEEASRVGLRAEREPRDRCPSRPTRRPAR